MAHHFVYIASPGEKPFSAVDSFRRISGDIAKSGNCFLLPNLPVCGMIIERGNDPDAKKQFVPLLNTLVNDCGARYRVVGKSDEVIFLIHFGGQGHSDCMRLTRIMNEAAEEDSNLRRFRFIAISRHNRCPEGLFTGDGKLAVPDDAVVRRSIEQWRKGQSEVANLDHLRGLCILCRALTEMSDEGERAKIIGSAEWWAKGIWGTEASHLPGRNSGIPAAKNKKELEKNMPEAWRKRLFSEEENELIERTEILNTFCDRIRRQLLGEHLLESCSPEYLEEVVNTLKNSLK